MKTLLALRLSRRALGAVALEDDAIVFSDSRHLTSRADRAAIAADCYLARILDQVKPQRIAAYVPQDPTSLTATILTKLRQLAMASQIPFRAVSKAELLDGFAARPLRSRRDLHAIVHALWPDLAKVTGPVLPYLADAAATAWYADVATELQPDSG